MHGEKPLAKVRRSLQIAQQMEEEKIRIRKRRVSILLRWSGTSLAIVEDDNLVDAEDRASPSDLSSQSGLLIVRQGTGKVSMASNARIGARRNASVKQR